MDRRHYVLVRNLKDVSHNTSSEAVQAGHAVAEWMKTHPGKWNNEYLIYLSVDSEEDLHRWGSKLERHGLDWVMFHEPDMNNEATALAAVAERNVFDRLPLL